MSPERSTPPSMLDDLPEPPTISHEEKFIRDLEALCERFVHSGGDVQTGAACVMRAASDMTAIAVLRVVQNEFGTVLAYLVNEVRELKGENRVPDVTTDEGETADLRSAEDGEDSGGFVDSGDDRQGG